MVAATPQEIAEPAPTSRPQRALPAGKAARRTKVIASLSSPNVIAEEAGLLERSYYGIAEAFKPRNRWQDWVSARIATLMLRIDRSERVERKLREWASYRAFDFWEDDQKLAAADLADKLPRNPARVAAQLRRTPAGLDWLVARWRDLARLEAGQWTEAHRAHAAHLLGGDDSVDPSAPGFAAARLADLEADRDRVAEADALLRGLVESDLSDAHVPDLAKLRRQVREWQRQLKWYVDQFHVDHSDRWDDPMRRPAHEKATPDGFREVDYNHFEGPRALEPFGPPPRDETKLTPAVDATVPAPAPATPTRRAAADPGLGPIGADVRGRNEATPAPGEAEFVRVGTTAGGVGFSPGPPGTPR